MITPSRDPSLVKEWLRFRDNQLGKSIRSLRQICIALADRYGCHPNTVRYHLDSSYKQKKQEWYRERKRAASRRRKWFREYMRSYRRLSADLRESLEQVFETSSEAQLYEITQKICEVSGNGVRFRQQTVERVLREYAADQASGSIRGPPYLTESNRMWRYADEPPESRGPVASSA